MQATICRSELFAVNLALHHSCIIAIDSICSACCCHVQVLSEFEDGRLLLSLLEQQREQARACRGASPSNGSSSDQGMLAAQLDVPYPPYSVAHFTINGAFQVCIPAENQTPTGKVTRQYKVGSMASNVD